jgi:hypothetical protein
MVHEADLLAATTTAHAQEISERGRAVAREMWLGRLTQAAKLQELLAETIGATAENISEQARPYVQPGSADRLASVLLRIEGAVAVLAQLGGPEPPEAVRRILQRGRQGGTSLHAALGLSAIADLLKDDESFKPPP